MWKMPSTTLPFRYEDRREIRKIAQLREGRCEVFFGEIVAAGEAVTARARKKLYEVLVTDGTGQVALKWFHYRQGLDEAPFRPRPEGLFHW